MRSKWTIGLSALAIAMAGAATMTQALAAEGDDEQAVRDAVDRFYAALNTMFTGDLEPMKDVWSHAGDVTYMGPAGKYEIGWEAVLADWESQAALKLGGKVKPEQVHIVIGRDIAIVTNYERGINTNPAGEQQAVSIRATNTFRKEDGRWKMIGHHTDKLPFLKKELGRE